MTSASSRASCLRMAQCDVLGVMIPAEGVLWRKKDHRSCDLSCSRYVAQLGMPPKPHHGLVGMYTRDRRRNRDRQLNVKNDTFVQNMKHNRCRGSTNPWIFTPWIHQLSSSQGRRPSVISLSVDHALGPIGLFPISHHIRPVTLGTVHLHTNHRNVYQDSTALKHLPLPITGTRFNTPIRVTRRRTLMA